MTVHTFGSTSEAYDATQCYDEIKKGDLLLIENEKVVGIADTWPVAITEAHGQLHTLFDHVEISGIFLASAPEAVRLAREKGWPVRGNFANAADSQAAAPVATPDPVVDPAPAQPRRPKM